MKKVEDYFEPSDENDSVIQKALREMDLETVINLCAGLNESADMIYRNLSARVSEEVKDALKAKKGKIPEDAKREAYLYFQKQLDKHDKNN